MITENPSDDLSPLGRARRAIAERRAAGETIRHLTPAQKSIQKPKSRTLAITANCYMCQRWSADPGVRWRIGNCAIGPLKEDESGCTLFGLRPYQRLLGRPVPALLARGSLTGDSGDDSGENSLDGDEDATGDDSE